MPSTIVIVPGIRDHVADHWQTLLAAELPRAAIVPPLPAEHRLDAARRVALLDQVLAGVDGPVILVGHSAGVITIVQWAASHHRPVKGALLAAPADLERPLPDGYPTMPALDAGGWLPVPRARLPFPTIVVASANDPLARLDRVLDLARDWGAGIVNAGAVGHLNPAAGYGPWPLARELVAGLDAGSPPHHDVAK